MSTSDLTRALSYGPSNTKSILIVDNEDGEGGGYDVYHGSPEELVRVANEIALVQRQERIASVEAWTRYNWHGPQYSRHFVFTILVIHADGTRDDFSLPEESTGL